MTPRIITSTANPLVKDLAALGSRRGRDSSGSMLIEGRREATRAVASGVDIELLVTMDGTETADIGLGDVDSAVLSEHAFAKISRRQNPDGVALRARVPDVSLERLTLGPAPLVLVAEGIEKPGNLGAMVRTAHALGIDAIVLADPVTDVFNPNTIRASQGAVFDLPVGVAATDIAIAWLEANIDAVVSGYPDTGVAPWAVDLTGASAIVVGAEAAGLTEKWMDRSTPVRIPMTEGTGSDSLNAATAAALLMYEATRQRAAG